MSVPPPLPAAESRVDHASVWQLVLGIAGVALALLGAIAVLVLNLLVKSKASTLTSLQTQSFPAMFWTIGLLLILAIPSIVYAARRLQGHFSQPVSIGSRAALPALLGIFLWGGLLYVGNTSTIKLPEALSPLLNILEVALPILLFLMLGLYRLQASSRQRVWGAVTLSAFVTTQIVIFLELLLVVLMMVIGFAWLSKQPDLLPYLNIFSGQKSLNESDLNSLLSEITPLLNKPGLYAVIALLFCLLIPLIEEAFKPLGVWFLASKDPSPAQGFTAGLICGATFGLLESLSMVNMVSGDMWLYTVIARIGTGLLHTFTAGVSGWALAKTWQDHNYWRLSLVYLGMVLLHGAWNLFALLFGLSKIPFAIHSVLLTSLMGVSMWVLYALTALLFIGLLSMNISLRSHPIPPELPIAPDETTGSLN